MLKTRIIPTLLMKDLGLVKGIGFDSWRRVGTVVPAIKVYNRRRVDELIVLDISATNSSRGPDIEEIRSFSSECFVPLTVGGGISCLDDATAVLRAGADKIAVNSALYEKPELVDDIARTYGSQCVVASIDARRGEQGEYTCYSHSGTRDQGISPGTWAAELESRGAGEIIITSIEKDGTMLGYDLSLIQEVAESVSIPVIASGGAGKFEDFYNALTSGKAQAVSAASMFHFTEQTPLEAKDYLSEKGIAVTRFHKGDQH